MHVSKLLFIILAINVTSIHASISNDQTDRAIRLESKEILEETLERSGFADFAAQTNIAGQLHNGTTQTPESISIILQTAYDQYDAHLRETGITTCQRQAFVSDQSTICEILLSDNPEVLTTLEQNGTYQPKKSPWNLPKRPR